MFFFLFVDSASTTLHIILKEKKNASHLFVHIRCLVCRLDYEFCLVLDDINGVCIEETVKNEIYFTFRNLLSSLVCQRQKKPTLGYKNPVHLSKNAE